MAWDLIGSDVPAYSSAMMIGMLRHTPTDVGVTPQSSPIQCGPLLGDETLAAFVAAFDYRPAESGQHHVDEVLSPIIFPRSQGHTSSMLQDLQAGRRTQIDLLNGALVRLADQHGLQAIRHKTLVDLIKASERGA